MKATLNQYKTRKTVKNF